MSDRRRGLGRGLGALIPQAPPEANQHRRSATAFAPSPVDVLIPERVHVSEEPEPAHGGPEHDDPTPAERAPGDTRAGDTRPGDAARGDVGIVDAAKVDTPDARGTGTAAYFAELPIAAVVANPRQPRQVFDEDTLAELVASIREVGLLQPVVVRHSAADRYELVMGERRWRACRMAGLDRIPAIVRSTEDSDLLRDALLENLHRSDLNPLEEAAAYDQLLQDFGCTHDELASRLGRSRPQVSNTLRLLRLPAPVQRRVAAGVLSAGHARALLGLDDPAGQERLAQRIVAEGMSVRAVEEAVAVGDVPGSDARRARRPRAPAAPALSDLAARLADRFETRVKVDLGRTKGKIVVEFASVDDLERIVGIMAPGVEQRGTREESSDDVEKAAGGSG